MKPFSPIEPTAVKLSDPVFAERISACRSATIPSSVEKWVLPGFMKTECFSHGMHGVGIGRVALACRRTA